MTNMIEGEVLQNYMRFRISPEMTVAMAVSATSSIREENRETVELVREPASSSRGDGGV